MFRLCRKIFFVPLIALFNKGVSLIFDTKDKHRNRCSIKCICMLSNFACTMDGHRIFPFIETLSKEWLSGVETPLPKQICLFLLRDTSYLRIAVFLYVLVGTNTVDLLGLDLVKVTFHLISTLLLIILVVFLTSPSASGTYQKLTFVWPGLQSIFFPC